MGFAKTEGEIAERTSAFLKAEIKKAEITYAELAERMKKHGHKDESENTVKQKLKRGTFPATWFLAALAALELKGVRLEDI